MLWTVANISTTGVPHSLNIRFTTTSWFGQDNQSAITLRQPGMCLAHRVMSESVATETVLLPASTRGENGSHPVC